MVRVDGHRLAQRQQLEAAVVDFDMELVQHVVAGNDVGEDTGIALDEAADGHADALLGEAAHGQQAMLEFGELFGKMPLFCGAVRHGYPNRPVT